MHWIDTNNQDISTGGNERSYGLHFMECVILEQCEIPSRLDYIKCLNPDEQGNSNPMNGQSI